MLNFRYHALSLVAVFLALAIGVVLGVAIGDKGVVSGARRDLENSLRGDLRNAREHNADLSAQLGDRDAYERDTYPQLVRGMLRGDRVGILAMGNLSKSYVPQVRSAIQPAGARLKSVNVVSAPLALEGLSRDLKGSAFSRVNRSNRQLKRFGRATGRQLVRGGPLPKRVRHTLFSSSRGQLARLGAIIYVRDRDDLSPDQRSAQDSFEEGLLAGMLGTNAVIVGVEHQDTDPSQIGFMKKQGLSSVDDVDHIAGQAALVYLLAGAKGQYGAHAGSLLPERPHGRSRG